jgi:hypothetical protein
VVFQDFQPMKVLEEPVCIYLFRQNPVFTSLRVRFRVRVVPPQEISNAERQKLEFAERCRNANRFFLDSHWLEIWENPSMGPNGGVRCYGLRLWAQFSLTPFLVHVSGGGGVRFSLGRRVCRHVSDGFHEVCGKCAWNLRRRCSNNVRLSKYLDSSPPAILF